MPCQSPCYAVPAQRDQAFRRATQRTLCQQVARVGKVAKGPIVSDKIILYGNERVRNCFRTLH